MNIKKNGRHIPSSPIAVMISQSEIGDASRVRVSGQGLSEARTFEPAQFIIDTRNAGVCPCGVCVCVCVSFYLQVFCLLYAGFCHLPSLYPHLLFI